MTLKGILLEEARQLGRPVHEVFHAAGPDTTFVVYDCQSAGLFGGYRQEQRRWVVYNHLTKCSHSGIVYARTSQETTK